MRTFAFLCTFAFLLLPQIARADLSKDAKAKLAKGEMVVEYTEYEKAGKKYVGGVAYLIASHSPQTLSRLMRDPKNVHELLPLVTASALKSVSKGGVAKIRVSHKFGPFEGGYTVLLMFSKGGMHGKFWLDRKEPSSVDDAWGYIKLTSLDQGRKTFITYGVLYAINNPVIQALFGNRIRRVALRIPKNLVALAQEKQ